MRHGHVIPPQRLDHRRAGKPRDQPQFEQSQAGHRQNQMLRHIQPIPKPGVSDARRRIPARRQPVQTHRKHQHQQLPQPKTRDRVPGQGHRAQHPIHRRPPVPRSRHPQRNPTQRRHHQRTQCQQQRRRKPLQDHVEHRALEIDRRAEIQPHSMLDIGQQLHAQRLIQPILRPDLRQELRRRRVPRQQIRRVTRRRMDQPERHHHHRQHQRHREHQPPQKNP